MTVFHPTETSELTLVNDRVGAEPEAGDVQAGLPLSAESSHEQNGDEPHASDPTRKFELSALKYKKGSRRGSLNDFIGARQDRLWHGEAERLRGF